MAKASFATGTEGRKRDSTPNFSDLPTTTWPSASVPSYRMRTTSASTAMARCRAKPGQTHATVSPSEYAYGKQSCSCVIGPETWPVTLILEDGHANAADAVRIFQQEREGLFPQYRPMLDTIRFASKKTAPPLAAVDMLAYSMFRMVAGYTTSCQGTRHLCRPSRSSLHRCQGADDEDARYSRDA
jgi:hypothetical protein